MKNEKNETEKKIETQTIFVIASFIFVILAAIVFTIALGMSKAWFANNQNVIGSGMQITSDYEDILFSDTITVERTFGDNIRTLTFMRDETDKIYYQRNDDNTDWYHHSVVDEFGNITENVRDPFGFSGLLPNETVAVTVTFTNIGDDTHNYLLEMKDITGETFTIEETNYTILGVYKLGDNFIQPIGGVGHIDQMDIATGSIVGGEEISVTFSISFVLDQYIATNNPNSFLSEKFMSIGSINISFAD